MRIAAISHSGAEADNTMTRKTICLGYLIALTVLLVIKNPLAFLESSRATRSIDLAPAGHLFGFLLLAILTWAARWPISRWTVIGLLIAYALGTELLQAAIPWRSAEAADFLLDLMGIALGSAVWWGAIRLKSRFGPPRSP